MADGRITRVPYAASGDIMAYSVSSNTRDVTYRAQSLSVNTIENILHYSTVCPRFRIFLLNPDETVREEIPPEDILLGGSYSENYQSGQRRSLSFSLINEDGKYTPSINGLWIGQKFKFDIGIEIEDSMTDDIVWFSKGIYVLTSANPDQDSSQKTVSVECADKFNIFESFQGTIPTAYTVDVGTEIEPILEDILGYNNGNGYPFDPQPMIYHSSFNGKVTQQTISEQAGSNWGSVIMALAEQLSAEVFYNAEGNLTLIPKVDVMNDGDKPDLYDFREGDGDFSNVSLNLSMSEVVNRVVVIGANVNGATVTATVVNENSSSPLCYQRIGYHTGQVVNDSNITSDILAQERAEYELRLKTILSTTVSNTIMFNPLLTVNNLITITNDFFEFGRERFLLQSISFSLDYSGTMSITSTNINNLPFTTN